MIGFVFEWIRAKARQAVHAGVQDAIEDLNDEAAAGVQAGSVKLLAQLPPPDPPAAAAAAASRDGGLAAGRPFVRKRRPRS